MAHYSVKQQDYQKFICRGLSSLQQNEDLVDMTIAADGHYIKVHKIVLSVASPYFKQIISNSEGHPVIYLNKVSFATLYSILEYIYMGESRIENDKLDEFIQVSNDLQINGLMDLIPQSDLRKPYNSETNNYENKDERDRVKHNISKDKEKKPSPSTINSISAPEVVTPHWEQTQESTMEISIDENDDFKREQIDVSKDPNDKAKVQFTVSNQGTLQAIFNRYIYNQCYVYKTNKNMMQWRCIQQRNPHKCPASMITEHDKIIKRQHAHNHPFHDRKILNKLKKNCVFAAINDAQTLVTKTPKKCSVNKSDRK